MTWTDSADAGDSTKEIRFFCEGFRGSEVRFSLLAFESRGGRFSDPIERRLCPFFLFGDVNCLTDRSSDSWPSCSSDDWGAVIALRLWENDGVIPGSNDLPPHGVDGESSSAFMRMFAMKDFCHSRLTRTSRLGGTSFVSFSSKIRSPFTKTAKAIFTFPDSFSFSTTRHSNRLCVQISPGRNLVLVTICGGRFEKKYPKIENLQFFFYSISSFLLLTLQAICSVAGALQQLAGQLSHQCPAEERRGKR